MKQQLLIAGIFLFATLKSVGQTSYATASATIVTPVGAEFTGDVNDSNVAEKISSNEKLTAKTEKGPLIKIIGEVFSNTTTVETGYIILKRKETETPAKPEKVLNITVYFD